MVYGVLDFHPIGDDEGEEEHRTDKRGENAHHDQGAFDALLLPSFTDDLRAEPDKAWARKLRPVFRGHLFENGVEVRIIHPVEPPILPFRISS